MLACSSLAWSTYAALPVDRGHMSIHYEDFDPSDATPCAQIGCGHRLDDHDQGDMDIIGGQCFECPCNEFLFPSERSEDQKASSGADDSTGGGNG